MHTCLVCGKLLEKRSHESQSRFEKKKFCSNLCAKAYMREHRMGWWRKGEDRVEEA